MRKNLRARARRRTGVRHTQPLKMLVAFLGNPRGVAVANKWQIKTREFGYKFRPYSLVRENQTQIYGLILATGFTSLLSPRKYKTKGLRERGKNFERVVVGVLVYTRVAVGVEKAFYEGIWLQIPTLRRFVIVLMSC